MPDQRAENAWMRDFRLRRVLYVLRRPLWSWYWLSTGYRMWRDDGRWMTRREAARRAFMTSLPNAAWHACGCNQRIKGVWL